MNLELELPKSLIESSSKKERNTLQKELQNTNELMLKILLENCLKEMARMRGISPLSLLSQMKADLSTNKP